MKKKILGFAAVLTAGTFLWAADQPPQTKDNNELKQLKARVVALESKLAALEKKLAITATPNFVLPPGNEQPEGKIWGEGQVNGWNYYVIPLSQSGPAGQ